MTKIHRSFVETKFGQIHYRRAGKPTNIRPLVCLHQSPKSSREFIEFMKYAASDRLVIALDTPGHGESDLPEKEDATIEGYSQALWEAVKTINLGKVDLLGHHTGAKIAAEMAYQRPDDAGHIVMISALVLTEEERENFKSQFQPIPLDEKGTRFKHIWDQAIKYRGPGVTLEQLAFSIAENTRAGEAYEWGHEAAFDYTERFAKRLPQLPHRIMVLNPKDMLFDYTPRVGKLLQNGDVIDYPDFGFGFMDTHPEEAVTAVKKALIS